MFGVKGFRRNRGVSLPPPPNNMPPFETAGWTFSGPHHTFSNGTSGKNYGCYVDNWVSSDTGWGSGYSPEWEQSTAQNITFTGQYEGGGKFNCYITVQGFKGGTWNNIDNWHVTDANNVSNWYSFSKTVAIKGYKKIRLYIQEQSSRGNRETAGGNLRINTVSFS